MNIIYIHTHDTGKVISPHGYDVDTPNYEAFYEEALMFQNAFCSAPTCSPSRASLLTGVYPHQNGMLGLAQRGFEFKKEWHLANLLSGEGYRTALCGVQHEIGYYTSHEMAIGNLGYQEDLTTDVSPYSEADLVYWDQKNAEALCRWLEEYDSKQPFYLSYGMHATHREYPAADSRINLNFSQPPEGIPNNQVTREDYAQYKTSVKMADDNLGKVIQTLKTTGVYDQTIIVLTTDHGIAYPFRKCTLFDAGIGVLLAVRVPDSQQTTASFEGLISQIDVLPTLFDLLEIDQPDYFEGKSFAPLFKGEVYEGNEAIFAEINFHTSYEPVRSVRTTRYKYIRYFDEEYQQINYSNIDQSTVKEFYKEHDLEQQVKPSEALYDLYYDATEKNNLVMNQTYLKVLTKMRRKLQTFMEETDDPLLTGPIPIKPEWKVNRPNAYSASSKNAEDYISQGLKWEKKRVDQERDKGKE